MFTTGDVLLRGPAALPVDTWSHLAFTWDGSTTRLYVNGTQVATAALTGPSERLWTSLTNGRIIFEITPSLIFPNIKPRSTSGVPDLRALRLLRGKRTRQNHWGSSENPG